MSNSSKSTITNKTAKLHEYVEWFEGDDFSVESALDKYREAEKLAAEIEEDLSKLKNEITVIKRKFDS